MHIPDGFLDLKTAATTGVLAAVGLYAGRRVSRSPGLDTGARRASLLGMAAAFVFAAQMINFPVVGGTSGHLIGGVLIAILLGPLAAVTVMTAVVLVQCLLFADGGITALGANLFNMALVAPLGGHLVWALLQRIGTVARNDVASAVAAGIAGWAGTMLAALTCAGQLAVSGMAPWGLVVPAMAGIHALIGLGEGIVTGLVVHSIRRRKMLVPSVSGFDEEGASGLLGVGFVTLAGVALFVSPWACAWPDGLESVAGRLGFGVRAIEPMVAGICPDYAVPALGSAWGTIASGVLGAVTTAMLVLGVGRLTARMRSVAAPDT
ncbi:MAG TPA: energy-coupling factor ABC transporter permease [Candidatus Ozemobacteraceae bacterium]